MSESALTSEPYVRLKTEFIRTLDKSITDNKETKLSQFSDKNSLDMHWHKVNGWAEALEAFKKLCTFIETSSANSSTDVNNIISPSITDGEIVQ